MEIRKNMATGQLIFVGLGLYDENDVTQRGIQEIQSSDKVFAEFYTSKLIEFNKKRFEKLVGKPIKVLSREETEKGDIILTSAKSEKVVFLTCGDPMIATTHVDLRIRAMKKDIQTSIVHSGSVVTAVPGILGLQSYKFGRTTTLAFPERNYFPTSPYQVIQKNKELGLHSLILLDIQADKDRYMTANEGIDILLQMEKQLGGHLFHDESVVCVVARAGSPDSRVAANTMEVLKSTDFGPPLHTLVIPGVLHYMEIEALKVCAGLPMKLGEKLQKV